MHRACRSPLHALAHFIFLLTHQMRLITVYIFPGKTLVLRKKGVPYSGSDEEKAEELGAAGRGGGHDGAGKGTVPYLSSCSRWAGSAEDRCPPSVGPILSATSADGQLRDAPSCHPASCLPNPTWFPCRRSAKYKQERHTTVSVRQKQG